MGQKINPIGFRLGVNRTADSRWYADSADFGRLLHEDIKIRKYIKEKLKQAGVSKVIIERPHRKCRITVHTARPGMVIGKKGADIETLRKEINKLCKDEVFVNLVEIRKPETDANLVAEDVARQLERRVSFRRAMKRAMQTTCGWAPRVFVLRSPAASAARRSRARNGIVKAAFRCTRCAPTSTTARRKPKPRTASSASSAGSSKARSWSTIRWPSTASRKRWVTRVRVATATGKTSAAR